MTTPLNKQVSALLATVDDRGTPGRRLADNSSRLCSLVRHLMSLGLTPAAPDADALDLACSAMQLTLRHSHGGRAPMTLRDRAESAAELLVTSVEPDADPTLLDRAVRLLRQLPQRSPASPEARLLADAVNLEDFGVTGLLALMTTVALAGDGVSHFLDACDTRERYGYWDARLARFHFDATRQMAARRLSHARDLCSMLQAELSLDGNPPS